MNMFKLHENLQHEYLQQKLLLQGLQKLFNRHLLLKNTALWLTMTFLSKNST